MPINILIEQGEADWRAASGKAASLPMVSVKILSPVTAPCRVYCQGANYRQHMIESGMDPDAKPFNMFFTKSDTSIKLTEASSGCPVGRPWNGRFWRILLKKSFSADERKFLRPLMRFARGDVRGHIISDKNDHGASYRRQGALQRWRRLRNDFCEILGVVRFSTFATVSARSGRW